jgi:hypothetical protein
MRVRVGPGLNAFTFTLVVTVSAAYVCTSALSAALVAA